jgi:hypothetical protein
MSQLVKTKRQTNFKDFKRFGAFKGLVEPKNVVFNSFECKLGLFGMSGPLKRSFHSRFKMAHAYQKRPNLHTNSSNKLLFLHIVMKVALFYTQNRSESSRYFFASFYSISLEMIVKQSIGTYFFCNFS